MAKKTAQSIDLDGFHIDSDDLDKFLSEDLKDRGDVVEVELEEADLSPRSMHDLEILPTEDFVIEFPLIPGAEDQTDVEEEELEVEDKGDEDVEVEHDPWKWSLPTFLAWVKERMDNVPRHSGRDVSGVERALSYCNRISKEFPRAARDDFNNVLDIDMFENARCEILDAIERLEDRLEKLNKLKNPKKRKKKADGEVGEMVKEAGTVNLGLNQVSIPYIISHITRLIMSGAQKQGKDAEDLFRKFSKMYELDKREKAQVLRLLEDSNFPMYRDQGLDPDAEEMDLQDEEMMVETPYFRYN